jgi:uncharacterized protein (DUF1501 family)
MSAYNRRQWLARMAGAGAAAAFFPATRLWAVPASSSGARLVVVMLRGAYDGLSALVPYSEPFYYEARPHLAIAPPASNGDPLASMRLDGRWALHPRLADSAGDLYSAGQLAFVPFCGTGFVSRSHFQAQDWLEAGKLPAQRPEANDGFLNRLVVQLGGQAVSFTQNLPVALRGPQKVANASVSSAKAQQLSNTYTQKVMAMYAGHALEPLVSEGLGLRRTLAMELVEEMQSSSREAMAAAGFALEAQRLAHYMREHRNMSVAFIDVGGWDTHAGQASPLANRLAALGMGVETMAQEFGREWKNTVVVVVSEFGRTFRENGSQGTDHGHGNVMWLAGGAVAGGSVRGEQAALDAASLHQGRDMPVLNEYRAVLGGVFARMFGLNAQALAQVFPGASPLDLRLV